MSSGSGAHRRRGGRFCPVCGRMTDALYGGLCLDCYAATHPLVPDAPKRLRGSICRNCGAYTVGKVWRNPTSSDPEAVLEEAARALAKRAFSSKRVRVESVEVVGFRQKKGAFHLYLVVNVKGSPYPGIPEYSESYEVLADLALTMCPACRDVAVRKEKAIVQVRVKGRDLLASERDTIRRTVQEVVSDLYAKDRAAVPVEIEETERGFDVKFASKRAARVLVDRLRRKFPSELLGTHKDMGIDASGRRKTKVTYRLLIQPCRPGDIVEIGNALYYVEDVKESFVKALTLPGYKEAKLSVKTLHRVKIVVPREMLRPALVIARRGGTVQVMYMADYSTEEIEAARLPFHMVREGKVGVAVLENGKKVVVPWWEY